jgi:hypothetical protein
MCERWRGLPVRSSPRVQALRSEEAPVQPHAKVRGHEPGEPEHRLGRGDP